MLEHFKSLSMEATVLENNNHSLESEAAKAKGALQAANEQISDLDRQLSHKDGMIRGYESQVINFKTMKQPIKCLISFIYVGTFICF